MFYLTLPGFGKISDSQKGETPILSSGGKIVEFSLKGILEAIIPYVMAFAGIILFLMLIFGGITMLSSAGNPEGVKKGQQMITNALLGFVIIFVAFWIMQALQIVFGLKLGFGN